MAHPQPRLRRILGLTACLLALGAGAATAHLTSHASAADAPTASLVIARASRMPSEGVAPTEAADPAPPSTASDARTSDVPAPGASDPAGERFRDGMIITGSTPHRLVLFTFDDGPHWKTTPRLLDLLDVAGVRAVFFITGDRLVGEGQRQDEQRALVAEIGRRGHLIANHTHAHLQLPLLTDAEVIREIRGAETLIATELGSRPWLLRLPGGARSRRIDRIVADAGYTSVLWNLGTGDTQVHTAEEVYATWSRVFERREKELGERGGIVLLHDTHEWSVEAFQLIYEELLRRNCDALASGDELYDFVDDPSLFFVPRADADPSATAPAARPLEPVLAARQAALRVETAQRCARSVAAPSVDR